jgi:ATP-binding cassette subfamily B protein
MLIIMSFLMITMLTIVMPRAAVSASRIKDVLETPVSITTGAHPVPFPPDPKGRIVFDRVSFTYPGAEEQTLRDISFIAEHGTTTAIIGGTGSGKSTMLGLMLRFHDVTSGSITIDGVDVREADPHVLMDQVAFVFQNNRLFKTSILENVRSSRPEATREEVQAALSAAQCDDILEKLPDGMDTVIGTEGTYLSGGEQQRVALARAILKDAPIVVLDEATAFADPETEAMIQKAFATLTKGRTVIMIAHRLSTVVGADKIIVLDNGKVAEEGNHTELVQANGLYARMWAEYNQAVKWRITQGGTAEKEVR